MSADNRPSRGVAFQSCWSHKEIFEVTSSSLVIEIDLIDLRERPDTIRSIVANLVGDDDGGDSLVDENEPIQPLQQPDVEDYSDPNWEPEPVDAGPGRLSF